MKSIRHYIGTIVLVLLLLSQLGLIDFHFCIGRAGACSASTPSKAARTV